VSQWHRQTGIGRCLRGVRLVHYGLDCPDWIDNRNAHKLELPKDRFRVRARCRSGARQNEMRSGEGFALIGQPELGPHRDAEVIRMAKHHMEPGSPQRLEKTTIFVGPAITPSQDDDALASTTIRGIALALQAPALERTVKRDASNFRSRGHRLPLNDVARSRAHRVTLHAAPAGGSRLEVREHFAADRQQRLVALNRYGKNRSSLDRLTDESRQILRVEGIAGDFPALPNEKEQFRLHPPGDGTTNVRN
jgi:hypothetical protein